MHDLTAERAAKLYNSLHAYIPTDRCVYASELNQVEVEKAEDIAKLTAALKTARQEALREAANVVNHYNCMHNHGKKATNACDDIVEMLDRLASEGG